MEEMIINYERQKLGFPVHNQVKKIKQEANTIIVDWSEMRPVLREIAAVGRQIARSPLGLTT
ncbi:hypothetical protein JCGZ_18088 [Jatropha curcas]|uniref:Uncharacterized protein n=1 Tax=Jatropha curcas TaxID=180498 RepID=A0A067KDS6_JATCU|nr:hypothetical protein JCGZ_18088 [Jatropha curcas]